MYNYMCVLFDKSKTNKTFWENRNFKFPVYFKEILYLCVDCLRMNEITTLKTWQKNL